MDFMKWLNSLDELLYEVMSWLLFFPLTLWRSVFRPTALMEEVESEARLPEDQQYASVLSPPLFLALALLLGHAFATALGQNDAIIADRNGLADLVDDNASALVLRMIVFAAFPLFLAARLVRRLGVKLDRSSLRRPFYAQCYPAAVFALGMSLSLDLHHFARASGQCLIGISVVYFWIVEARWFARTLNISYPRAFGNVFLGLIEGASFLLFVGFLFTR